MAFMQNPTGTVYNSETMKLPKISALETNLGDIKEEDVGPRSGEATPKDENDLEFESAQKAERKSSYATRSNQSEEQKQEPQN